MRGVRQLRHSDAVITLQKWPESRLTPADAHVIGDAQRQAVEGLASRVLELTGIGAKFPGTRRNYW